VLALRELLSPTYAVSTVNGDVLLKEPWPSTCAMLVMPGGADLGYCAVLNGKGNSRIKRFVQDGGSYLGLCAGGYYGSGRCEFELGDKLLEVQGDRELAFFPGICRGCAYSGFKYHSENGACAAQLKVTKALNVTSKAFQAYYNGGGVFVDAGNYHKKGVEVLASYIEETLIESGTEQAAVVYCKVGSGGAILTGPHPEFVPESND